MKSLTKGLILAAAAAALTALVVTSGWAQPGPDFLSQVDANHDGSVTRDELNAAMAKWLGGRPSATQEQLSGALESAFPESTFMGMISPPKAARPNPPTWN